MTVILLAQLARMLQGALLAQKLKSSLLGPAGPKVKEPLAQSVLDHADPACQCTRLEWT